MGVLEQYAGFSHSLPLFDPYTLLDIDQFTIHPTAQIANTTEIEALPIPPNEVLGKRVEYFFEYYLKTHNQYTLIAKNIQIFQHKTTIGELDFLVHDHTIDQILHIELSYKFYIYVPTVSDETTACWIGPNQKDTLLQKVHKLNHKQFPLLYTEAAKPVVQDLGIPIDNIQQQYCMLGQLFLPFDHKDYAFMPPLNPKCIYGFWVPFSILQSGIYLDSQFYMPEKKDWITSPNNNHTWYSLEEISTQISPHIAVQKSPLLWMKSKELTITKLFVVWW